MLTLILGGARSGKSRCAEQLAQVGGKTVIYVATAEAGDDEMQQRIDHHRQQRPDHWVTVEEPIALASTLAKYNQTEYCLLVDCLTLWLTNLLLAPQADTLHRERQAVFDLLPTLQCDVIFVSNEVGQGVVPMDSLSRRFVDEAGFLHQQLAAGCQRVLFTVAGLTQCLKGTL